MQDVRYRSFVLLAWIAALSACAGPSESESASAQRAQLDAGPSEDEDDDTSSNPSMVLGASAHTDAGPPRDAGPRRDATTPRASGDAATDAANGARPTRDAAPPGDAASGASGPGAGAATAAPCHGKPGAKRGKSDQTLSAGGAQRSFVYYAPEGLEPDEPVPLVAIVPHGTNMSGQGMFDITKYSELADRERFVVIFPDGIDGPGSWAPWNVGFGVCGLGSFVVGSGDDQAFVDELLKFAQQNQCIDERHVFMPGFSMGGYFAHETSCLSTKIAAIAPHSAGTHDLSACPAPPKPSILFHFESDSLIDYSCGTGARDQLLERNGCSADAPDVVTVKGGTCEYYKGCAARAQVAFCSLQVPSLVDDGLPSGHGWSGGVKEGGESFAAITNTESATELGWAFFKKYAW